MAAPTCSNLAKVIASRSVLSVTVKAPPMKVTAGKEMFLRLLLLSKTKLPLREPKLPTLVKLGATYDVKWLLMKLRDALTEDKDGVVTALQSRKVMSFAQIRLGKETTKSSLLPAMLRSVLMLATWVSNFVRRTLLLISMLETFFKLIPSRLSMKVFEITTLSAEEIVCGNVSFPNIGRPAQLIFFALVKTENDSVDNAVTSSMVNVPPTEVRLVLCRVIILELFLTVRSPRILNGPEMSMTSAASDPIIRVCKSGQVAYLVKSALELMVMDFVAQSGFV